MRVCEECGRKQTKQGKCWDAGYCAKCIIKKGKLFDKLYRQDGYHTRVYKKSKQGIEGRKNINNYGAGSFVAPRDKRTAPTIVQINKASGKRLVELLDRRIGEIYG